MSVVNRFDFEQNLMKCWNVTEDIDLLYRRVMDGPEMSDDDIANFLLGMKTIYDTRFNELFTQFEQLVNAKKL